MIALDPNGIYTATEVAALFDKNERTIRRALRRIGKKKGALKTVYLSADEVRKMMGVR